MNGFITFLIFGVPALIGLVSLCLNGYRIGKLEAQARARSDFNHAVADHIDSRIDRETETRQAAQLTGSAQIIHLKKKGN